MPDPNRRHVLSSALGASGALLPGAASAALARPDLASGPVADALALCQRACSAVETELNLEGSPGHAEAYAESRRLQVEMERLRIRLAAKSPKTWEDVAVLAVIALYWDVGEVGDYLDDVPDDTPDDEVLYGAGDRALPTLFLAVLEVLGISPTDTFTWS
jgi:hypothetical protein